MQSGHQIDRHLTLSVWIPVHRRIEKRNVKARAFFLHCSHHPPDCIGPPSMNGDSSFSSDSRVSQYLMMQILLCIAASSVPSYCKTDGCEALCTYDLRACCRATIGGVQCRAKEDADGGDGDESWPGPVPFHA